MATEFYRQNFVSFDTEISPQYADAYLGNQTTIDVSGGNVIKKGIFEFKIADEPTFGSGDLFRLKVGLHTNSINRGIDESRLSAFLMKTNLSDNPLGFEEGSLYLRCEEFLQLGAKPSSGPYWQENFDTETTLNNPSSTTVDNLHGTVTRTAEFAIFVDDFISWIAEDDVTGGKGGGLYGLTDFAELSQDFEQFMDDDTTAVEDTEALKAWLVKNYAIKSSGFAAGEMQTDYSGTAGWTDVWSGSDALNAGALHAGAGTFAGGGLGLLGGPFAPLTVPVGAAGGFIIGGLYGLATGGFDFEEGVHSEWDGVPKKIDADKKDYVILLNKSRRSSKSDRYVPKTVRGGASKWWVAVTGGLYGDGGLDESGYIITGDDAKGNVVVLQDVEIEGESGLLGEVTPDNSMAFKIVTQEPQFDEDPNSLESAKLRSVGRVNFTKNNTLSGMNMLMKNVWNYSVTNTHDATTNTPTLMGHRGPVKQSTGVSQPFATTDTPLGITTRQETRAVYGKIPRPPATNRSPGFVLGQPLGQLNSSMWSTSRNLMRYGNANQWAFQNSQGVSIEFEIYFDSMSEGWCESDHPMDLGPGQPISSDSFDMGSPKTLTSERLMHDDSNNPYGIDKDDDWWDEHTEISFTDLSSATVDAEYTIETETVAGSSDGVFTLDAAPSFTLLDSDEMYVHLRNTSTDNAMILSRRGFHVTLGDKAPEDTQTFADYMLHNLSPDKANYLLSFIKCGDSNVSPERRNKVNVLWQDSNYGEGDDIALGAPQPLGADRTAGRMTWLPHKGEATATLDGKTVPNYFTDIRWANLHIDPPAAPNVDNGARVGAYRNNILTLDTGKWYRVRLFMKPGLGHVVGDIVDVSTGEKIKHHDGTIMRDMQIGPGPGTFGGYLGSSNKHYEDHLNALSTVKKPWGGYNDGTPGDKGYVKPPDIENITDNSQFPNYLTMWNCNFPWNTDNPSSEKNSTVDIWTGYAADARNMETRVQIDGINIIGGNWDKEFATVDSKVSTTQREYLNIVTTDTVSTVGAKMGIGHPDDTSKGPLAKIPSGWCAGTAGHLDRYFDYHSIKSTLVPYTLSLGFNEPKFAPYMYDCTLESSLWTIDSHPTVTTQLGFVDQGQTTDIDTDFFKGATIIKRTSAGGTPVGWYSAEITAYNKTSGALSVTNILNADGSAGTRGSGADTVTIVNEVYSLFNDYSTKDSTNGTKLTGTPRGTFAVPLRAAASTNMFHGATTSQWANTACNMADGTTGNRPSGVVTADFDTKSVKFNPIGTDAAVIGTIHNWSGELAATFDTTGTNFYFWAALNTANGNWGGQFSTGEDRRHVKQFGAETVLFRLKIGNDATNYWWRDFTLSNFLYKNEEEWTLCSVSLTGTLGQDHVEGNPTPTGVAWIKIEFNDDIKDAADVDNGIYFYGGYLEPHKLTDVMATFSHNKANMGVMKREDFITTYDKNFIAANEGVNTSHKVVGLTVGDASKEVAIDFGNDTDEWTTTTAPDNASVSGFTSKGFVRWRFDATGQTALDGGWGDDPVSAPANDNVREPSSYDIKFMKRENIFSCARIIQVMDATENAEGQPVKTKILVDRPDVFTTTPKNTKFVIFQEGEAWGTTTTDSTSNRFSNISIQPGNINSDGTIDIEYPVGTDLTFLTDKNCNSLFIGPQMYWIILRTKPVLSSIPSRSYRSVAITSNPYTLPIDSRSNSQLKSSASGSKKVTGPTFNETLWANSEYANRWQMDLASEYPAFVIDKDWGFGAASDTSPGLGYIAQSYIVQNNTDGEYNEMEVNTIFRQDDKKPGDRVSLLIAPLKESNHVEFNFDSAEGTNKPYLLTTFLDRRPSPPPLALMLGADTQATKGQSGVAEDAIIQWQTQDTDLWYGLLHIDTGVITSQYYKSVAYIPMDEGAHSSPKLYRFDQGTDRFYFKPSGRDSLHGNTSTNAGPSGVATTHIEGLAGYALDFAQVTNNASNIPYLAFGNGITSIYTEPTTNYNHFTFSTHVIPDTGTFTKRWIVHQRGKFGIWLDSDNKVNTRVYYQKGTGTISNPNSLKRDHSTTYYATHEASTANSDTGDDVYIQTDAVHGLTTGDKLLLSGSVSRELIFASENRDMETAETPDWAILDPDGRGTTYAETGDNIKITAAANVSIQGAQLGTSYFTTLEADKTYTLKATLSCASSTKDVKITAGITTQTFTISTTPVVKTMTFTYTGSPGPIKIYQETTNTVLWTIDDVSIIDISSEEYNGFYPHITVTATDKLYCGPVQYNTATYVNTTPVTWRGFNYIELKGSTSIPNDGETPTHIALLVDAETGHSNVSLYINGKVEDMSGKARTLGDNTHWQLGATLMKSDERLIFGGGHDVEFGIAQHAADNDGAHAAITEVAFKDTYNLDFADDWFNNALLMTEDGAVSVSVDDSDKDTQLTLTYPSTATETLAAPWVKWTTVTGTHASNGIRAGEKYRMFSKYSFDGKMEEVCMWNRLVFPTSAEQLTFAHPKLYHLQELPDGNDNAGSLTYNAKLFLKDFHNIRGARPSRIATSNLLGWRKPSFSLNTT